MEIFTKKDWKEGKMWKKGTIVEEAIYEELRDCLPPAWDGYCKITGRRLFQLGEPYGHLEYKGKCYATYESFVRKENGWEYTGEHLLGRSK